MRWEDDEKEERKVNSCSKFKMFRQMSTMVEEVLRRRKLQSFFRQFILSPSCTSYSGWMLPSTSSSSSSSSCLLFLFLLALGLGARIHSWEKKGIVSLLAHVRPHHHHVPCLVAHSRIRSKIVAGRQWGSVPLLLCCTALSTVSLKLLLLLLLYSILLLYNIYCTAAVLYNVATLKRPPCPSSPSPPPPPLSLSLSSIQKQI